MSTGLHLEGTGIEPVPHLTVRSEPRPVTGATAPFLCPLDR
jgi:hypothetical protein